MENLEVITDERVLSIAKDCYKQVNSWAKEGGYSSLPNISWVSFGGFDALGKAYYASNTVGLNKTLFKCDPKLLKQTIYHELLHHVAGPAAGHRGSWKKLAGLVNNRAHTNITRTTNASKADITWAIEEAKAAKHAYRCKHCGKLYIELRESKFTRTFDMKRPDGTSCWRCGKCRGEEGFEEISIQEYIKTLKQQHTEQNKEREVHQ